MTILKISKLILQNNILLTVFQDIKTENLLSVSLSLLYYVTKLELKKKKSKFPLKIFTIFLFCIPLLLE